MVVYGIVYGIGFAYFIRARGLVTSWRQAPGFFVAH